MDLIVFAFRVRFSSVKIENGKRHSCTRKDGDPFGEQQTGPNRDGILANLLCQPPHHRSVPNDRFRGRIGRRRVEIAVHLRELDSGREKEREKNVPRHSRNERVFILLQNRDEHLAGRNRTLPWSGGEDLILLERERLLVEK